MTKVVVHPQAEASLRALPPEPRRRLVQAIKALPNGDTKNLEGALSAYFRLRVGGYRVIYADSMRNGARSFDCIFIERRAVVYEIFEQILAESLLD